MDNFWLLTAVRFGLPALLFLMVAIVCIAVQQSRYRGRDNDLNRYRMGWLATIFGLAVSGITVHFWNALFAYFFFLIGTGAWMARPVRNTSRNLLAARLAATLQPPRLAAKPT